jgi:hypothetical protein
MRTYGRIFGAVASSDGAGIISSGGTPILPSGTPSGQQPPTGALTSVWVEISTDANGNNDFVWLTTLCQCLLLNLGEDPVFSNYGIPVIQSVQQGVPPDLYVARMQQAFAPYFASLKIQRDTDQNGNPVYKVGVMTNQGVTINASVPIPY